MKRKLLGDPKTWSTKPLSEDQNQIYKDVLIFTSVKRTRQQVLEFLENKKNFKLYFDYNFDERTSEIVISEKAMETKDRTELIKINF